MKILLINLHSSRNAGDAVLTLVTIDQLKKNFPGSQITLVMNDPSSFEGEQPVQGSWMTFIRKKDPKGTLKWRWWVIPGLVIDVGLIIGLYRLTGWKGIRLAPHRWRPLLKAYMDADLVVSSPGGFLRTSGLGLTYLMILFAMGMALLAGKPLYIFPQSIGPLERPWERRLLRWVMAKARIIMTRESISLDQLKAAGIYHPRCYALPDLAFTFAGSDPEQALVYLKSQGIDPESASSLLGITAMNWGAQNPSFKQQSEYEAALAGAIRHFIEAHGGRAILYPQVCGPSQIEDDRIPARRVYAALSDLGSDLVMIEEDVSPELLKACYGFMDLFIGTRMHSNIFALTGGTPVIAIAYQFKTLGIMRDLGLERWVLDINTIDSSKLIEMLEAMLSEIDCVTEKVRAEAPKLVHAAELAGVLIAADFQRIQKANTV